MKWNGKCADELAESCGVFHTMFSCRRVTLTFSERFATLVSIQNIRINSHIVAPELRVIDEAGNNVGVLPRAAALELAQGKGLDLIEVAPGVKPPVARIMNFDKFRYEEEKKRKKRQAAERGQEFKQIQITGRTARNDLNMKVRRLEEFLTKGYQVTVVLVLRGREKRNKEWAFQKLREFMALITISHHVMSEPRVGGRGIILVVSKRT